jgi:gas vesicle protein
MQLLRIGIYGCSTYEVAGIFLPVERGDVKMNRFRQGILIGLVLSIVIVLAVALTLSDERRRQLTHRLEELRSALPGIEQIKQSAQEATTRVRETGSNFGEQVQESASKLAHRTQDILTTAQQKAASLGDR